MKAVVFDSYALIAFFRQEAGYEAVRELLVKMANGETEGFITTVNVGEVYYMISRKSGAKYAATALDALLKFPLVVVDADLKLTLEAAAFKSKIRFIICRCVCGSFDDTKESYAYHGDAEFDNLKNEPGLK
jgi:predicted nucleic acid-binding protein